MLSSALVQLGDLFRLFLLVLGAAFALAAIGEANQGEAHATQDFDFNYLVVVPALDPLIDWHTSVYCKGPLHRAHWRTEKVS